MNKIMELADKYAMSFATQNACDWGPHHKALATEVQAQRDYTRAVIAERDALKYNVDTWFGRFEEASKELIALRKAAQMAEVALYKALHTNAPFGWDATKALAALRKELGQ